MATANADREYFEIYLKILNQNRITSEIENISTVVPKLDGVHFSSRCESVSIYFKNESLTSLELFVKKTVTNEEYGLLLREMQLFETEEAFFKTIFIDLEELVKRRNGFKLQNFLPTCYYADKDLIVLENLAKSGYYLLEKHDRQTFQQACLVLSNWAKLQGTSYVMVQELGEEIFLAKYPFLAEAHMWCDKAAPINAPVVQNIFDTAIKILKRYPSADGNLMLDQVLEYENDGFSKLAKKCFDTKSPSCAKVLCHGDIWGANMLFKANEETREFDKCVMIDFQTVYLGKPSSDIVRYIYLAVDPQVRRSSWKKLLEIYYNSFSKTVHKIQGIMKFSLEDLISEYRANAEPGYYFSLLSLFDKEGEGETPDIENIKGNVMDALQGSFNTTIEKLINEEGEKISFALVEAFHEYQALIHGFDSSHHMYKQGL